MRETGQSASPAPRERLLWIDAARGLGIILVALVHITALEFVPRVNTFVLPLFFFLSGVSCALSRQEGFMGRRIRGLLIPYFIFGLLSFLYWALLERHYRPPTAIGLSEAFFNVFYAGGGNRHIYNSPMWFLPCLFVMEAGFYAARRFIAARELRLVALALCALAGFALSGVAPFSPAFKLPFRLPWMLDTALLGVVFYAAGAALGKTRFITQKPSLSPRLLLAIALAGCALNIAVAAIFPAPINLSELELPNPVQFYCMSIVGITGVCALVMRFPAAWLCILGRNSLTIMCVHDPLKRLVIHGASVLSGMDALALRQWPASIIAIGAVTLSLALCLAILVNKYFPWMIRGAPLPGAVRGRVTGGQEKRRLTGMRSAGAVFANPKYRVSFFICSLFVVFFYLGIKIPAFTDDYFYRHIPLANVFTQTWEMYFVQGGRILGHAWMFFINAIPACAASCITAMFICLLCTSMHIMTYGAQWRHNLSLTQLLLPAATLYLFLPDAWEVLLWRTGMFYVIAAFFTCVFLVPYRLLMDGRNCLRNKSIAYFFVLFAFTVPFWIEIIILPALWLAAAFLFLSPKEKKTAFWPLAAYGAFLAGSVLTLAAPGNFARAGVNAAFDGAVLMRTSAALIFKYLYTVCFPTVLCIFFVIATRFGSIQIHEKKNMLKILLCFFIASIFSAVILLCSGNISYRALSFSFILVLIAMNIAYWKASQIKPLLMGVPLILTGFAIFWGILTCIDYKNLKDAEQQRDQYIASLKTAGEKVAFLKEYPGIRQNNFSFLDSLRGNPRPYGDSFAAAYGLEHAYLLMDPAPETLEQSATQKWQGSLAISPTLTLRALLVAERESHKVVAAAFTGKTEQISDLVFLTAAADSSMQARIAQLFLPSVSFPMVVSSLPQRFLAEVLDRTFVLPAPNTRMQQDGTSLYYARLHPRAGRQGPLTLALSIKTRDATVMVRVPW